jgi:twitching motility protein PilI
MQGDADDIHSTAAEPDHPAGSERRSRLRQYQVQLLERMQAARSGAATGVRELGVVIRGRYCLLELTQIGEIVTAQPLAPVPLARDWYLGLANVRGDLAGVIDLARYAGWESGADSTGGTGSTGSTGSIGSTGARRFITFSPRLGFNCALLADRVLGLRQASDMRAVAALAEQPAWGGRQFDDADGQRWTLIDLAQLVREPRFGSIGF